MKAIYIDSDFKCHVTNDGTLRMVEDDYFDKKCDTMIEAYRFVPTGESWTRDDGAVFYGKMIVPWKNLDEAKKAQREYEKQLLAEYTEALRTVGVNV